MKRVLFLCAGVVLLLTTLQFGQNLGHDKLLFHSTDRVRWTQCAFGPDGVLWVVWVPGDTNSGSGGPVWIVSYDGTTVSAPEKVTDSDDIVANRPHISVSPKGHVLVSWGVYSTSSTYLRIRDPKTGVWGDIETVEDSAGGDEPNAHMDRFGNIHVLYSNEDGGVLYARSKIDGTWESKVQLSQGFGKQGSLAMGLDGTAHAVWVEKNSDNIYENYYSNRTATTSWYTREGLNGETGSSNHPWVAVGSDSKPVIVWQDITNPDLENGSEIRVLKLGSTYEVAIAFFMQHFPRIVVDNGGYLHVACQVGGGDTGSGIRYTNNKNGVFKGVQTIAGVFAKVPGLAADPFGNVAATQSSYITNAGSGAGSDIWAYSLKPLHVVPAPTADFSFSPQGGYPPLTVNFDAVKAYGTNGKEVYYDWVFSDGETASGQSVTHVFQSGGTFNVRLIIMDNLGRADEAIKTIAVTPTNPLAPLGLLATVGMSKFWRNPEITFNLYWSANPGNIPEHIIGYAVYMKTDSGEYTRLLVVSPSTVSASFRFTDLKVSRAFAVSTLGYGGTESALVYF